MRAIAARIVLVAVLMFLTGFAMQSHAQIVFKGILRHDGRSPVPDYYVAALDKNGCLFSFAKTYGQERGPNLGRWQLEVSVAGPWELVAFDPANSALFGSKTVTATATAQEVLDLGVSAQSRAAPDSKSLLGQILQVGQEIHAVVSQRSIDELRADLSEQIAVRERRQDPPRVDIRSSQSWTIGGTLRFGQASGPFVLVALDDKAMLVGSSTIKLPARAPAAGNARWSMNVTTRSGELVVFSESEQALLGWAEYGAEEVSLRNPRAVVVDLWEHTSSRARELRPHRERYIKEASSLNHARALAQRHQNPCHFADFPSRAKTAARQFLNWNPRIPVMAEGSREFARAKVEAWFVATPLLRLLASSDTPRKQEILRIFDQCRNGRVTTAGGSGGPGGFSSDVSAVIEGKATPCVLLATMENAEMRIVQIRL